MVIEKHGIGENYNTLILHLFAKLCSFKKLCVCSQNFCVTPKNLAQTIAFCHKKDVLVNTKFPGGYKSFECKDIAINPFHIFSITIKNSLGENNIFKGF